MITPVHSSSQEGKILLKKLIDRYQMAGNDCRQTVEDIIADKDFGKVCSGNYYLRCIIELGDLLSSHLFCFKLLRAF